jgi:YgiT-type zinc finger domain-containing protein
MKCVICKTGTTQLGVTTAMFDRHGSIVVVKDIPAQVCAQCGEAYFSADMSRKLYERVESALENGTELEVIRMKAA